MPQWWPPVEFDPSLFNPQRIADYYLNFSIVFENREAIFQALLITISLALLAEVIGIVLGLALSLLKISRSKLLSAPAQLYIDLFRGTPLLVQITIIYFALAPVGIRFSSLFFAGLTALSLNSAAYVAEIFRSGIQSIDKGQMEAGRASGLSYAQTMRHIIVPQAFRRVIPPLTNEFVMLIKDTSLVSVIGLAELLRAARVLQSATFNGTPLIAIALLYLAICLPLIYLTNVLERKLNRRTA
ncbi:amino ABC transporter, permease protein, 3-TM region, His/Glu/Gln/Arg/opine family [Rubrobacter radiotolerans]|uniref:Amino ABC transporter, permease protein, 3-TM region, His/Glu/Gln/Arg/opine family n=1 Tax=Rubrobacter radiotolerans TaxID=42256 RepID=A0A023X6F1_RUBRA|nr:amino acid ABC transporter permease [Rubrobacter radiotolerans]AHY47806.1 amino ABC transporter, permease protein, 3-TM region, His/Glu/Gln/Arg/opine family [Rubrobacter radiotolerans]MDX5892445.1 amino acid ABC transporter permease [Rubrobacter radiotolerans]SMC07736.1 polar amino acid transport system permease protein [Rubrobacter radiotolerans DSM 5868]